MPRGIPNSRKEEKMNKINTNIGNESVRATDKIEAMSNPATGAELKKSDTIGSRKRIPMSVPKAKLSVPEIDGYHLHWINDYAGRIAQAHQGGYEFVNEEECMINNFSLGTASDLSGNTDMGSRVSVVVGKNEDGTALRAYLMKIRNEWFAEDQEVAQERVNAVDQQIKRGHVGSEQDSSRSDTDNRYVKTSNFKANSRRI